MCRSGLAFAWLLWACTRMIVASDAATTKYFEQLRQRQLFSVAEGVCLRRLSESDLSAEERLELTLELSRTFAAHAHESSGAEQEGYWQRAEDVLKQFSEREPNHPSRLLLETQAAFVKASQGESLKWLSELRPHDQALRTRGLQTLDDAISSLTLVEKQLVAVLRASSGHSNDASPHMSPFQLRALLLHVRFQLGAAHLDRASLFQPGTPDRVEALIHADEWLEQVAGGASGDDLTLRSQFLLARSRRLQGEFNRALHALNALEDENLSLDLRNHVVAEKARVLLASNKPTDAAKLLLEYRRSGAWPSGEVSFLNAQALGALWKIAQDKQATELATELLEKIEAHVGYAEHDIGGYWGNRCRVFLNELQSTRKYGAALAAAMEQARSLYATGRVDESIQAYSKAQTAADEAGQLELAMQLGYTAASILCEKSQFEPAAEAFHGLTQRYPQSRRVSDAHLLWAYCLGQLSERQPDETHLRDYAAALREHRRRFPESETAVEATWMLARLEEAQRQFDEAIPLYASIPTTFRFGLEAQRAVARCSESFLDQLAATNQPADQARTTAIGRLESILESPASNQAEPALLARVDVAVRLARIIIKSPQPDFVRADKSVKTALGLWNTVRQEWDAAADDTPVPPAVRAEWKSLINTATQLNIITLAGRHRMSEAEGLVHELARTSPAEVLAVLNGLMSIAKHADPSTRQRLASLQLETAETLVSRQSELTPEQQRQLDLCRAQAYAAVSYLTKAIEIYDRLVRQTPGDKALLITLTELLSQSDDSTQLRRAKSNWRKLESTQQPGSIDWLTYRYSAARCCFQLHEYDECGKLLKITRILYPTLGNAQIKTQFEQLQDDLDQAR